MLRSYHFKNSNRNVLHKSTAHWPDRDSNLDFLIRSPPRWTPGRRPSQTSRVNALQVSIFPHHYPVDYSFSFTLLFLELNDGYSLRRKGIRSNNLLSVGSPSHLLRMMAFRRLSLGAFSSQSIIMTLERSRFRADKSWKLNERGMDIGLITSHRSENESTLLPRGHRILGPKTRQKLSQVGRVCQWQRENLFKGEGDTFPCSPFHVPCTYPRSRSTPPSSYSRAIYPYTLSTPPSSYSHATYPYTLSTPPPSNSCATYP